MNSNQLVPIGDSRELVELLIKLKGYLFSSSKILEEIMLESGSEEGLSANLDTAIYNLMIAGSAIGDIMEHLAKGYEQINPTDPTEELEEHIRFKVKIPIPDYQDLIDKLTFMKGFISTLLDDFRLLGEQTGLNAKVNTTFTSMIKTSLLNCKYNIEYEIQEINQGSGL